MRLVSIGEAALMLGVSVVTMRRWEKSGKLVSVARTFGNHRRYDICDVRNAAGIAGRPPRKTIAYARVSTHGQKDDLQRQAQRLDDWCRAEGFSDHEVIRDLGSGLNYKKKGLSKLLRLILRGEVSQLVITNKDRLLRFGAELVFDLCKHCGTIITILDRDDPATKENELARDVIELMTVFSAKMYGQRSHKNLRELTKVA